MTKSVQDYEMLDYFDQVAAGNNSNGKVQYKHPYPIRFGNYEKGGLILNEEGDVILYGRHIFAANGSGVSTSTVTLGVTLQTNQFVDLTQGQHIYYTNGVSTAVGSLDSNTVTARTTTSFDVEKPTDWVYEGLTTGLRYILLGGRLA